MNEMYKKLLKYGMKILIALVILHYVSLFFLCWAIWNKMLPTYINNMPQLSNWVLLSFPALIWTIQDSIPELPGSTKLLQIERNCETELYTGIKQSLAALVITLIYL